MVSQYAIAADLESGIGELPIPDVLRIEALLEQASRECDEDSGLAPGHWATVSGTFEFEAHGGDILRLRDGRATSTCCAHPPPTWSSSTPTTTASTSTPGTWTTPGSRAGR